MPDRFYQLTYPENKKRPVYVEDAGNLLLISGILLQGMGANYLLLMPSADEVGEIEIINPTLEEWCAFIHASDDPKIFEEDETGTIKAIHRKVQRSISGAVQQKIWYRDGFQCMFCGKKVPDIQVTIDHFFPLELGGIDDPSNYISACRQCQKSKGNRSPKEYCQAKGLDYEGLVAYLQGKASKLFINHLQNP
jgi:hypothetical protein